MMRRWLAIVAAVIFSAQALTSEGKGFTPGNILTREYRFDRSHGDLEVDAIYNVELVKGPSCSVRIEYSSIFEDAIDVRMDNGVLVLGLKSAGGPVQSSPGSVVLTAVVTMPEVNSIRLSGASRLDAKGEFPSSVPRIYVEAYGESVLTGLVSSGNDALIKIGGGSDVSLECHTHRMEVRTSGASKLRLGADTGELEVHTIGSSSTIVEGNVAKSLYVETSGASAFNASGVLVDDVEVVSSGSSSARVYARDSLKLSVTDVASVFYRTIAGLVPQITVASRAATIQRIGKSF